MAQSGYNANVVAVGRTLMSLVGADRSLERDETALRALSCLRLFPMHNGMLRVSGQLDPEAGAVLRAAALDPLSAPHPTTPNPTAADPWASNADRSNPADADRSNPADCNGNGTAGNDNLRASRDLRPPERRRAEALVELCRRAAAAGGAAPATSKAQIVVTIDYNTLKNAVKGAGHSLDGTVLSPQSVRKLACDASIIPMVLGSKANPWTSDAPNAWSPQPCSPPYGSGTKPAPSPAAGDHPNGPTPTTSNTRSTAEPPPCYNLALLCGFHPPPRSAGGTPTWVHQRDLTATVTAFGVTWKT
jgi:hypothetical protein